jgi:serine kinase of HPr protein (carbohydrate metabolism regulator)
VTARIHATTVAIGERAVVILGPSGAGKSDLALRLIDRKAMLVADDYTELEILDGTLLARPPATIAGKLEVRGIGIVAQPFRAPVRVALAVRLGEEERMPEPRLATLAGVSVPEVTIDPRAPAAPLKVELALEEWGR